MAAEVGIDRDRKIIEPGVSGQTSEIKGPLLTKWLLIATLLYIFDIVVPIWVQHRFGIYCDINPITNWLFQFNPVVLYGIKIALFVLLVPAICLEARKNLRFAFRSVQLIVLGYAIIDFMWLVALLLIIKTWLVLWS